MWNTETPATLMPIGTISNTTWAEVNSSPREGRLKVRTCCLSRPAGAFLAAELTLLTIVVFEGVRGRDTFGTAVLLAFCGIFFHLNQIDKSIVSSQRAA